MPPLTTMSRMAACSVALVGIVGATAGTASTAAGGACTTARQAGMNSVFPTRAAQSNPGALVLGPDGNMWFTDVGSNAIGRMTPQGAVTEFALPTVNSVPYDIVAGPDGNLWFTEGNRARIGRITTAGVITEFGIPWATLASGPNTVDSPVGQGITVGPDGNLWFAEGVSAVGKVTTDGVFTQYPITVTPTPSPGLTVNPSLAAGIDIASGPGGMLWVSLGNAHDYALASVTTDGVTTSVQTPTGDTPMQVTSGPDGNLWYTNYAQDVITRMVPATTPGGTPSYTRYPRPVPSSQGAGWTTWGGRLWFAGQGGQLGSVTTGGVITEYPVATTRAFMFGMSANPLAAFPDGAVAMGEDRCGAIGVASTTQSVGMRATQRPATVRRGRTFTVRIRSSAAGVATIAIATATNKVTLANAKVAKGTSTVTVAVPKRLPTALVGTGSTLVVTGTISGMPRSGQSAPVTVN